MPLAILTFLVTIAFVPGLPSAAIAPRWVILMIGAASLLPFLGRIRMGAGHWFGLAFLAWTALSVFWSSSPNDTIGYLIHFSAMAVLFCYAANTTNLRPAFIGFILAMNAMCALALLQVGGSMQFVDGYGVANEVAGTFLNKNTLAIYSAIALALVVYDRGLGTDRWQVAPLLVFGAVYPQSRTAWLMLAAIVAWPLVRRFSWRTIVAALLIAFVIGGLYLDAEAHASRIISMNSRIAMWSIMLNNMVLAGWGLGTFENVLPFYTTGHNEYLQFAFESGIGAIALAALIVYCLMAKAEVSRVAFVALLVACLPAFPLHEPVGCMVFALLAGHLCNGAVRSGAYESWGRDRRLVGALGARAWRLSSSYLRPARQGRMGVSVRHQSSDVGNAVQGNL